MKVWVVSLFIGLVWVLLPAQAQGCSAPRWEGKFFNTPDWSGTPVFTSCDAVIAFDWGIGAPAQGVVMDNFSVRWTSLQTFPAAGNYLFTLVVEDGARLYLNGELLLEEVAEGDSPRTLSAVYNVPNAGATAFLTLEVVGYTGNAQVQLVWALTSGGIPPSPTPPPTQPVFDTFSGTPPPTPAGQTTSLITAADTTTTTEVTAPFGESPTGGRQPWAVEYFDVLNPALDAEPIASESAPPDGIARNYSSQAPLASLPADGWSARWTRWVEFPAGIYTFILRADDRARVQINGVEVLNQPRPAEGQSFTIKVQIPAGAHQIIVEHADGEGTANLFLTWEPRIGTTLLPDGCNGATAGINGSALTCAGTTIIGTGVTLPITVVAGPLYFRPQPSRSAATDLTLHRGERYFAVGRTADNVWLQVEVNGQLGWVMAEFVQVQGDINSLSITDGSTPTTQTTTNTVPVVPDAQQGAGMGIIATPTGNATVEVQAPTVSGVRARALGNMRLRQLPSDDSPQIGNVAWGQEVDVVGRTSDGRWLQLIVTGITGWSAAEWYEIIAGDVNSVPITN